MVGVDEPYKAVLFSLGSGIKSLCFFVEVRFPNSMLLCFLEIVRK
ncbi:hypothetical protein LEP1GSC062_1994 [Leptospira alexanderi serovar Manhao 3 str. L 60]|uniref:Uncharacterized protein n=1 Tax=Leptospira alexanderi serovar Manhao 3 str. L 60 TaxID=1049759 RepID=V6HWX9_9LEPT|nr:hypothetical protein LEP1GSC062_1994 [Leptospira alexanderi serovar Manhao 3 str. L 60]